MQALFDKLESVQVDTRCLISEADRQFCDPFFEKYKAHAKFWKGKLIEVKTAYALYKEQVTISTDDFYYAVHHSDELFTTWKEIINSLTETLIGKLETHFKHKYALQFSSYAPDTDKDGIRILLSYEPIITSMVNQVGADLAQSGKQQIKEDFQELFRWERHQPELKGKKIVLPCFYGLDYGYRKVYLSYRDDSVSKLLSTVSLFLDDATEQPISLQQWFWKWKDELELGHDYHLEGFSMKFFKNGRIDLSFENALTAKRFFDCYQLENIIKTNKENDNY